MVKATSTPTDSVPLAMRVAPTPMITAVITWETNCMPGKYRPTRRTERMRMRR